MFKRILISLSAIVLASLVIAGFMFWQSRQAVRDGQVYAKMVNYGYHEVPSLTHDKEILDFVTFEDQYGNRYNWYYIWYLNQRADPDINKHYNKKDLFLITIVDGQVAVVYTPEMMEADWMEEFLSQPVSDQVSTVDNLKVKPDGLQATVHTVCFSQQYDYKQDLKCRKMDLTVTDRDKRFFVVGSKTKAYLMIGQDIPLNRIILFIPVDVSTLDQTHFEFNLR